GLRHRLCQGDLHPQQLDVGDRLAGHQRAGLGLRLLLRRRRMSKYRTPLKNARGLGSAKSGTVHFIHQRLTATALVALTIWFLCFVLSLVGADYVTAVTAVAKPWNAIALVG